MNYDQANTILAICAILSAIITIFGIIFKKGKKEADVSERVSRLETVFTDMTKDVKDMKENHLAHIQDDMNEMKLNSEKEMSEIRVNLAGINKTLEFITKK